MLGEAGLAWEVIWLWLVARGPVPTTSRRDFFEPSGVSGGPRNGRGGLLFPRGAGDLPGPDHSRRAVAVSLPGCRRRG